MLIFFLEKCEIAENLKEEEQVLSVTPIKYEMLVSLSMSKNSAGAYQIDSQENEVIQYQTQTEEW